jgi:DNA-binding transcriptional ArsR family regulator
VFHLAKLVIRRKREIDTMDRLQRRHQESVIVSKMMLKICFEMIEVIGAPHFGPAVEPLLVAMAIRENDGDGKPPMKVSDLVKRLKMPRSNVRRALAKLLDDGMIHERNDSSYVGSIDYLAARIDAEYFIEIKKAVHAASAALKALET